MCSPLGTTTALLSSAGCVRVVALAAFVALGGSAAAQSVEPGPHAVGFRVVEAEAPAAGAPPLPVYLWYPAEDATGRPMPYGDYLVLTQLHKRGASGPPTDADREAAADLPRGIARAGFGRPLTDDEWQAITDRTTTARRDADPLPGPFPLVLGGLNGAQSAATLAEHLTSHGYVVAGGPMPREAARQQRSAPLEAVGALAGVLDAALAEVARRSFVDTTRLALVGVNFDGYTVLDTQMRTGLADAVLTLDGREAKVGGAAMTRSLPHFDPGRLRVPYLAFSMDVDEPTLRPDEAFFEELRFSDRQAVVLDGVEHFHYIGDLLAWPHIRDEVEPAYAAVYGRVRAFLDAHLRGRASPSEAPSEDVATYQRRWPAAPARLAPRLLALSVADLDASVAWYRDVLGFSETARHAFPDDRMRLAFVERDGFELELIEIEDTPPFDAPTPSNPATRRGLVKVAFDTADIDGLFANVQGRGVRVQSSLQLSNRTGGRFFILLDPDGNWVQVFGP